MLRSSRAANSRGVTLLRRGLSSHPQTVVVGGGIVGASAAYHLARAGRRVIVLEQNTLTSGSTWHAAGLVAALKGHEAMVGMAQYSRALFERAVDNEGNNLVGWAQTGSLGLARSPDMWTQLLRSTQLLKDFDIPHTLYAADPTTHGLPGDVRPMSEARLIHPLMELEENGIIGAVHTPGDGIVNPADACMEMVRLARRAGARFVERCGVDEIQTAT